MKLIFKTLLLFVLFCSCKTHNILVAKNKEKNKNNQEEVFRYNASYQYKIRKDDKISLSVSGEESMSVGSVYGIYNSNEVYGKWLLVDANGNIEIPKIGTTYVVGMTIPEFKFFLKEKLKKWLIEPVVDVKVLNKEITILGEVRTPNAIQVDKDHNTLLEIVSKAGGFEFYADLKRIKILRQENENVRMTNINLTKEKDVLNQNVQLHPGDIIIVPSKKFKEFDKRVATIIPFTTTITAAAILLGTF